MIKIKENDVTLFCVKDSSGNPFGAFSQQKIEANSLPLPSGRPDPKGNAHKRIIKMKKSYF